MNKILSVWTITILLLSVIAFPVVAQEWASDTDQEEVLAELLNQLEGSEAQEAPQPEPEPAAEEPEQPEPVPEEEEEHNAAEEILGFIGSFEYAWPEVIDVPLSTIEDTSVVIRTTQILYDDEPIEQYRVYYSTNTIADFLELNDLQEVDLEVENTIGTIVELSLDNLMPETTYYLIVSPVDPTDSEADPLDIISEEIQFTTLATVVVPDTPMPTEANESGPSDNGMYVEDVSYTYNDNKATVTWTAKSEASTVWLSIKKSDSTEYMKLADVPASAWRYTFTVQEPGLHLLKVETKNANWEVFGKEQIQSIKIDAVEAPAAPVESAPAVWPTQNLLLAVLITAILAGFGYNYRRQEVE